MLDWFRKSWQRRPAHPPNSLAYFQVYSSGREPIHQYGGPVWSYGVAQDVKLECHLLPVLDQPSFLSLPKKGSLQVYPPVFQVSGQIRAEKPEELSVDDWLAQGTLWWLKQLGRAQVTGLLAYMLLVGYQRLDHRRFPEIEQTMGFLLGEQKPVPAPPAFVAVPAVVEKPAEPPPRVRPWSKFPVQLTVGPARLQFLDRRDGKCCWRVGKRVFWKPLWENVPLSVLFEVDDWKGSEEELRERVRADFVAQIPGLLPRLARYPAANRRLRPLLQRLL